MPAVRVYIDDTKVGPLFRRALTRASDRVRESVRDAARDAADEIEERGRADISAAGNFGSRWTQGFRAKVTEGGGHVRISVTEDVPYWTVFQYGKVIQGKPLLWIPISGDAKGVNARDYGPLFRVTRKRDGLPLLLSPGTPAVVRYFGKTQVKIPKKFHLVEIARDAARHIRDYYAKRFRQNG